MPSGPATIEIPEDVQNQPTYKNAKSILIILQNFRDKDLNHVLNYLGIETAGLELELMSIDAIKNSKLIQEGNPTHRNREVLKTTDSQLVLGENLQTLLREQRVHEFLRKSGLGGLISNPSDALVASTD